MPLAGQKVRASDIITPYVLSKAAAESVTSSTTLQDDDDFVLDLEAGKSYRVRLFLSASGAAAGDLKAAWATTATITKTARKCLGPQSGTADVTATSMRTTRHGISSSVPYGLDGTNEALVVEELQLEDVTVAGTLTFQWAQNASSGTATTLNATSTMVWSEVTLGS